MTGPTATTTGHGLAGRAASMIKEGKSVGCRRQTLDGARNFQRKAQFYLDFLEAENSTGFHTTQGGCEHSRRVDRRLAQRDSPRRRSSRKVDDSPAPACATADWI